MKKFFQFAFVAVAAIAFAACGNKNADQNQASGSASAQTEQASTQDAAGAVAENDYFKIGNIPAGWENANTDSEKTITINLKPGTDLGEFESVSATAYTDYKEAQALVDDILKNDPSCKVLEDVSFGGQTFKQVKWDSSNYGVSLITTTPKGVVDIILSPKLTLDNPDVKAILESVSFK